MIFPLEGIAALKSAERLRADSYREGQCSQNDEKWNDEKIPPAPHDLSTPLCARVSGSAAQRTIRTCRGVFADSPGCERVGYGAPFVLREGAIFLSCHKFFIRK